MAYQIHGVCRLWLNGWRIYNQSTMAGGYEILNENTAENVAYES